MSTMKEPTYNDLIQFIDKFVNAGLDVRVFRVRTLGDRKFATPDKIWNPRESNTDDSVFYIGDFPVEKKFSRNLKLTREFITTEIHKVKSQKNFDKTVKPYPARDLYYQILINDFDDLCKLRDYWVEQYKDDIDNLTTSDSVNNGGDASVHGKQHESVFVESAIFEVNDDEIPESEVKRQITIAVLQDRRPLAFMLAQRSGVSPDSDTLEGRVLQGDWDMASSLAKQRYNIDHPNVTLH